MMDFEIPCQHVSDGIPMADTVSDYYPLDRRGVEGMLALAQRHAGDAIVVSTVQRRLGQGIVGMTCPHPDDGDVARRHAEMDALFVERYREGPTTDLTDRIFGLLRA